MSFKPSSDFCFTSSTVADSIAEVLCTRSSFPRVKLPTRSSTWRFLFPRLKRNMKGKRFATVEEVKQKSLEGLKDIPMSEFKNCFEQWKNRLEKCVVVNGEYFEGDQNLVLKY
ncbi:hypothetical protein ALC60_00181 [Trachymyrmex zeteki]|uniref:Uncharacterized protein n=1 Tax=Mycetomoellerius zeteki TaxID=64791 RepID=A0A151WVC2_9HYME|nr:PREDICTED: uncharacterized protein LOC108721515 [Trachymyrmex zeteki]XP_018305681.1 PREDICTED: uncharacterized protein LOC108724042 [Trachymyrmex zeteki]XP_018306212.1 PREDICTED: uncharacterized protein LOC108724362 [Trachymyrmex zeteki]XP_018307580.1 PREDICTED: uncharacterized protein LOC108725209 [Trachymyrmex zeteki]XP_018308956.1 PREDICTED: uncharacterized protein LOC108726083 [Trachymyrmex zeteki]XP_018317238.1 PREDICTED: uncharacterized protein LOC108731408 [Trachymyrmex zeteki]KYQ48